MYLKGIETYGFKSFADKINFEFTNNINGIVGPNGSGKSNVVDAVRWVLGEQSNKQLRTDTNTSVIFSGSKSRKALNSAMVNLVFDNTDRHVPIDFNEVSIKRILYRTGENEYYLNGEKCRLKDITEILTDSGAAKEAFNIIGQGKIDEILSTKPTDRRVIFEETAGVLKYKKRKEEAIRKLERTNNNLNRINDIINELENNLKPLEEQSAKAREYLQVKEKLTDKEVSLSIYDIDNYSMELNSLKEKISTLNDEINELNTNNTTYDISILQGKDRLNKIDLELTRVRKELLESTKLLEQTDADIRIFRERKKYISQDNTIDKVNSLKENLLIKQSEVNSINSEIDIIKKNLVLIDNELIELGSRYKELNNNIDRYRRVVESNNHTITDLNYKANYLEESINNDGGIPAAVRSILNNPKFNGIHNIIGSLIEVSSEYSLAVSTSLGGISNYLVVESKDIASKLVNYLKDNRLGRATFYPLDVIKGRYVDDISLNMIRNAPGYIDVLSNKVSYDKIYENIILNCLGNVILVDTIENANVISTLINRKYKIVTLDGQVVNVGGSITGGDKIKSNDLIRQRYELDEYHNKINSLKNNNQDYLSKIDGLSKELNECSEKINTRKMDKYNKQEVVKSKNSEIERLNKEVYNLDNELKDIGVITNNSSQDEESLLLDKYYEIKNKIAEYEKSSNLLKIDYDKVSKDISELEGFSRTDTIHINKLEKEVRDYEVKCSKYEVLIDNLLNSLNEDYTITYNEAKDKYKLEDNPEDTRVEVANLKKKIRDIGIVNLGAIEEYDRNKERYDFLMKQKNDLNMAEDTLLKIIHDMDEIMKDKFITTFNEVRVEFKKVFKELFKGGDADIYLTEPDNILETGIELEATPPGKNLRNIQSLSGGERTFTAISLLFAILNVRPVPFCLLDEVEAALDEANVDAFGEYLDKYRDKTQFILITHKKKTMEFVNTLYGITMQESGVSKLVSVKLDDIKKG